MNASTCQVRPLRSHLAELSLTEPPPFSPPRCDVDHVERAWSANTPRIHACCFAPPTAFQLNEEGRRGGGAKTMSASNSLPSCPVVTTLTPPSLPHSPRVGCVRERGRSTPFGRPGGAGGRRMDGVYCPCRATVSTQTIARNRAAKGGGCSRLAPCSTRAGRVPHPFMRSVRVTPPGCANGGRRAARGRYPPSLWPLPPMARTEQGARHSASYLWDPAPIYVQTWVPRLCPNKVRVVHTPACFAPPHLTRPLCRSQTRRRECAPPLFFSGSHHPPLPRAPSFCAQAR